MSMGELGRPTLVMAEKPSVASRTLSPMPASTASSATTASPRSLPSRFKGWTSSSLRPSWLGCFWVATSSPTTRAISMLFPLLLGAFQVNLVDDADHGGIERRLFGEREAGFLAAHPVDELARAGAGAVAANQRLAGVLELGG